MNLQSLTKNKAVLYGGAAVVAGAGLFVVMKLRGSSASSSTGATSSGDAATPGATVAGGFPDTSGTDIASWLGQYSSGFNTQLGDITSELGDIQTQLGNLQPTNGTGTGGTTPPITTPPSRTILRTPGGGLRILPGALGGGVKTAVLPIHQFT